MSQKKEKKLRKIKNIKIWPQVLGTVIFFILFSVIVGAVSLGFSLSIVLGKVTGMSEETYRFAEYFSDKEDLGAAFDSIIIGNPDISGVYITDKDGAVIGTVGEEIPNYKTIPVMGVCANGIKYRIYADTASGSLLSVDDDGDFNIDSAMLLDNLFTVRNTFNSSESITDLCVVSQNLWCEYDMPSGNKIAVKNNVKVRMMDFFSIIFVVGIIGVFMIVMLVYQICSIVSMFRTKKMVFDALYTDTATGGKNWQWFTRRASDYIYKNRKNKYKYAVVHIRMEKYRSYCACYGVAAGEDLVEDSYDLLMRSINGKELVSHKDLGDFGLLMIYNQDGELADRIFSIKEQLKALRPDRKLYFAAGICKVESPDDDIENLYNGASAARSMLSSQNERRIAWYNEMLQKQEMWEHRVENDMDRAIENREFQVYLQPKYSTKDEKLSGAEALVRWIHPTEGFIPPGKFVPIFEKNGFVLKLDDYMLTEVARQQGQWLAEGKQLVPISVNVSRAHFTRDDLAEHILSIVDSFNVPHWAIELELTESAFFDDKEILLNTVKKMKQFGFAVSMDDFGAGYSSLNSLKELPLDVVKLDAEFFRGGEEDRGNLIVEDTIALAKKLGMRIVAEGIETREQVDFLAERECDLIQGYFFAKPMPISDFEVRAFGEKTNTAAE